MDQLQAYLADKLEGKIVSSKVAFGELTIEVKPASLLDVCYFLINDSQTQFDELIDVCGVDYLAYGQSEWNTDSSGFSRGVQPKGAERFSFDEKIEKIEFDGLRFATVYQLLSVASNQRLRIVSFCEDNDFPVMNSVVEVWKSANWFEREAFDLFGIMFTGHPDLRRIMTDYGFVGHPFRKDFPLIGHVEMRYDEKEQRVVYEPVSIEPRVLVPRVIREVVNNPETEGGNNA